MNDLKLFSSYYVSCTDLKESEIKIMLDYIYESPNSSVEKLLNRVMAIEGATLDEGFLAALGISADWHIAAITKMGPGFWVKNLPGAFKSAWEVGGIVGGKAGAVKAVTAVGAPPVAAAALIIYLSFQVYKHFIKKKGNELCSKFKGDQKKECVKKLKETANKLRIKDLQRAAGMCTRTKNPEKCRSKIGKKISALQAGSRK